MEDFKKLKLAVVFGICDTLLVVLSLRYALFYGVMLFVLPITMAVLAYKTDKKYAFGTALVVGFVSAVLSHVSVMSSHFALANQLLVAPLLVMGLLIAVEIEQGDDLFFTSVFSSLVSGITLINLYVMMHVFHAVDASELTRGLHTQFLMALSSSFPVEQSRVLADMFTMLLPSAIVSSHFLLSLLCTLIVAKIYKKMGTETNIRAFSKFILSIAAARMTVILSIGLLLFSAFGETFAVVLANGANILATIASIAGLAGLIGIAKTNTPKRVPILLGSAVLYVFAGSSVLYIYGIIDAFVDFRGVRKGVAKVK